MGADVEQVVRREEAVERGKRELEVLRPPDAHNLAEIAYAGRVVLRPAPAGREGERGGGRAAQEGTPIDPVADWRQAPHPTHWQAPGEPDWYDPLLSGHAIHPPP